MRPGQLKLYKSLLSSHNDRREEFAGVLLYHTRQRYMPHCTAHFRLPALTYLMRPGCPPEQMLPRRAA
jgi:hypothetical protein